MPRVPIYLIEINVNKLKKKFIPKKKNSSVDKTFAYFLAVLAYSEFFRFEWFHFQRNGEVNCCASKILPGSLVVKSG